MRHRPRRRGARCSTSRRASCHAISALQQGASFAGLGERTPSPPRPHASGPDRAATPIGPVMLTPGLSCRLWRSRLWLMSPGARRERRMAERDRRTGRHPRCTGRLTTAGVVPLAHVHVPDAGRPPGGRPAPPAMDAMLNNPGLNGLIASCCCPGMLYAFRQVTRLYPEIRWVNAFRIADPGLAISHQPVLLAPMAAMLRDRTGSLSLSATSHALDHGFDRLAGSMRRATPAAIWSACWCSSACSAPSGACSRPSSRSARPSARSTPAPPTTSPCSPT